MNLFRKKPIQPIPDGEPIPSLKTSRPLFDREAGIRLAEIHGSTDGTSYVYIHGQHDDHRTLDNYDYLKGK